MQSVTRQLTLNAIFDQFTRPPKVERDDERWLRLYSETLTRWPKVSEPKYASNQTQYRHENVERDCTIRFHAPAHYPPRHRALGMPHPYGCFHCICDVWADINRYEWNGLEAARRNEREEWYADNVAWLKKQHARGGPIYVPVQSSSYPHPWRIATLTEAIREYTPRAR